MKTPTTNSTLPKKPRSEDCGGEDSLLRSLRRHDQVVESDTPDVELAPGQTHVYVTTRDGKPGKLVEKRKSFFSK